MQQQQSQRQLRMAELIRQIVAESLSRGEVRTPGLVGQVAVTAVDVSPDMRHARVFFVPMLTSADSAKMEADLNLEAPFFSQRVARQIKTKYTPRVHFRFDASYEKAQKMEDLLRTL